MFHVEHLMAVMGVAEIMKQKHLNAIYEARAYQRLLKDLSLSQEELAKRVGKDRASVANILRLLKLPKAIQEMVILGSISMGHARALLSLSSKDMMTTLAGKIIKEQLSVRRTESITKSINKGFINNENEPLVMDSMEKEVRRRLEHVFGTRVVLRKEGNAFALVVHYADADQLNGILERLGIDIF